MVDYAARAGEGVSYDNEGRVSQKWIYTGEPHLARACKKTQKTGFPMYRETFFV